MFVQIDQREHKVVARRVVGGRLGEQLVEQHLGIGVVFEMTGDHRQHAQGLDIIRMGGEVGARRALGIFELAIGHHAARGDDLGRQACELGNVSCGVGCVLGSTHDAIKLLQRLPACRQGRVVANGPFESLDGFRGIACEDMAVPTLLKEP